MGNACLRDAKGGGVVCVLLRLLLLEWSGVLENGASSGEDSMTVRRDCCWNCLAADRWRV